MSGYDTNADGIADLELIDNYGDGVADVAFYDTDQNGVAEAVLSDANNDGVIDGSGFDTDQNGVLDLVSQDVDQNGIAEVVGADTNSNGTIDYAVTDFNQDGVVDVVVTDSNENGVADSAETATVSSSDVYTGVGPSGEVIMSGPGVVGPATNPDPFVTLMTTLAEHTGSATFGTPDSDGDQWNDNLDHHPGDPYRY